MNVAPQDLINALAYQRTKLANEAAQYLAMAEGYKREVERLTAENAELKAKLPADPPQEPAA